MFKIQFKNKEKHRKRPRTSLTDWRHFSFVHLLVIALVFGAVGAAVIKFTKASDPFVHGNPGKCTQSVVTPAQAAGRSQLNSYYSASLQDYYYTLGRDDVNLAAFGYCYETANGFAYQAKPDVGATPLHQYYSTTMRKHFYSTADPTVEPNCCGYKYEKIAAYVSSYTGSAPNAGVQPLYRFVNAKTNGHYYTTSGPFTTQGSRAGYAVYYMGYSSEGIQASVWTTPTQAVAVNPYLLAYSKQTAKEAIEKFQYKDGVWLPARYNQPEWGKYQNAAVAAAALGTLPDGTAAQRQMAIDTINTSIARHQLPNGDFDNGTAASGSGGVNNGFLVEGLGLAAWTLRDSVPPETLKAWAQSVGRYANYLQKGDAQWYSNGNINIRYAVIMLEAHQLAKLTGDPNTQAYWDQYVAQRDFLVNPGAKTAASAVPKWKTYGKYSSGSSMWFSEGPSSDPLKTLPCVNGMNPCNGFDPNYTMAQLEDALIAGTIGGDNQFWQGVITGEFAALKNRISNGNLNASNGSRRHIPSEVFYAPVYGYNANRNLGTEDQSWLAQITAHKNELKYYYTVPDPGPNAYHLVSALALPLIDVQNNPTVQ
jgi:hypothetical protein